MRGRRRGSDVTDNRATFEASDFFVLRLPSLPLHSLFDLREEYEKNGNLEGCLVVDGDQFQEALFLASANLFRKLRRRDKSGVDGGDDSQGLSIALARYAFRMSRRCTPFGAFAGVGVGKIGKETCLDAPAPHDWRRLARIDQAIVAKARADLLTGDASNEFIAKLTVELNTSLWKAHDGYRYVEAVRGNDWTHYELSRVTPTPAVDAVYDLLKGGALEVGALARTMSNTLKSDVKDAQDFISKLLREQFLDYRPRLSVTGGNVVSAFVQELELISEKHPVVESLSKANKVLECNEFKGWEKKYQDAVGHLSEIFPKIDAAKAIQVDIQIPGEKLTLSRNYVQHVLRTLEKLSPLLSRSHSELASFAAEFERRYGDSSVPLLEALDGDLGIGFGDSTKLRTPMLSGIPMRGGQASARVEFRDIDAFLQGRVQQAVANGEEWIDLTDEELEKFSFRPVLLPSTASILGTVESGPKGPAEFSFIGAFGPPAAMLLGRFAAGSPELTSQLREFMNDAEEVDGSIVAEFAHLPDGRVGNVILRPVLRRFEIPYLGASGAAATDQITPDDLEVFCRHGTVHLWSRSHQKEVLPRISNAHNSNNALNVPLYRFVGALQRQGEPIYGWQWGAVLNSLPFLPGLRHDGVSVSRPRWRLYPFEAAAIATGGEAALQALIDKRRFPLRVRVRQGDNYLELDLAYRLDRDLFIDEARRHRSLECEAWEAPNTSSATAGGMPHANEVVIPVRSTRARSIVQPVPGSGRNAHPPGSDWLYAQIFCGPAVADRWLAEAFPEWAALAEALGCRDAFFIRYQEQGSHLRVRVRGPHETVWGPVRRALEASLEDLLAVRAVTRVQYSTYFPELSRYGGEDSLSACEAIFAADSLVSARLIGALPSGADRESARWQAGFRSIFHFIRAFGLNNDDEIDCIVSYRDAYAQEFSIDSAGRAALNAMYRSHRKFFDAVVAEAVESDNDVFDLRTASIKRVLNSGNAGMQSGVVLSSLLHMSANRIFPERARAHELAIFHALAKSLASVRARARSKAGRRCLA